MKKITILLSFILLSACGGKAGLDYSDSKPNPFPENDQDNGQELNNDSDRFACSNFEFSNVLYINTEDGSGIESKEVYKNADYRIVGSDFELEGEMGELEIRGRGNSTWGMPKKPYRLKFKKRQGLYGMAAARNYVLLAEYTDKSLLRNYLAHRIGNDLNPNNDGHRLETRFVELCLNGQYEGFYLLTEQVAVDKNRLNIDEELGFLIEMEGDYFRAALEGVQDQHWFELDGLYYVIKSPDIDDILESDSGADQVRVVVERIKSYLISARSSLIDEDKTIEDFRDYFNEEQFIDYFLLNELVKNRDVSFSSVYMHSNGSDDSRIIMGPLWDFDLSFGNADYGELDGHIFESPYGFWASENFWFSSALSNIEFKQHFVERFEFVIDEHFSEWIVDLEKAAITIESMADNNYQRWDTLGKPVWPNPEFIANAATFSEQVEFLENYLTDRKDWLLENIRSIR